MMKPEEVAQYLQQHPQFFNEYADLLADIQISHPQDDKVISLNERQVISLRERNRVLQDKLLELISFGEENDAIGEKMHRLAIALLAVSSLDELFNALYFSLKEDFAVPLVALRLWGVREAWRDLPVAAPVEVDAITLANSMKTPYCGPNAEFQAASWLPDGGATARSLALMPLRKGVDPHAFGMLVLGSADPSRFQMNMGTAFLDRIAEITSAALARVVD